MLDSCFIEIICIYFVLIFSSILIMPLKEIYFGLLINSVLSTQGDDFIKISPDVKLFETPEDFKSTLSEFTGHRSCGGPAKLVDWRYEGCKGDGVCKIPSDGKNLLCQFTFIPSESIPGGIYIRFNVSAVDFPSKIYDVSVPNSSVKGGTTYTLETAGNPTKELKGKGLTFQHMVLRKEDNSVETCAVADFENV